MGDYARDLDRWLSRFPRDRLLIEFSEAFKADPFSTMRRIEDFVGLPHADYRAMAERNARGFWQIRESVSGGGPGFVSKSDFEPRRPPMSAFARAALGSLYRESTARLRRLAPDAPW
jgi:hypothetical protein